ncbi:hypothetical protein ACLB2K_026025 [Fragaria x ananassa]
MMRLLKLIGGYCDTVTKSTCLDILMNNFAKLNMVAKLQEENSVHYKPELSYSAGKPQHVNIYVACVVNDIKFLTLHQDCGRKTQNSGVMCVGTEDGAEYYGAVISVVELVYATGMPVVLLKCRWFNDPNIPRSTKTDHGLLSVNTCISWYENQPFIVATMTRLVFYLDDPKEGGCWKVVNVMSHRGIYTATTLEMGIANRDIENVTLEPYQEASTSNIPDTETIRINNNIHFQPCEYVPISNLEFDFGSLPFIQPDDEEEDSDDHSYEVSEDDLEDRDYVDSD